MKKKFLFLLSALCITMLSTSIIACGNDDDDEIGNGGGNIQNVIVGTWTRQIADSYCTGSESWTFNKGGSGVQKLNTTCNAATVPYTYTIIAYDSSSKIGYVRIIYSDGQKTDQEFTTSGNTLHIFGQTYTK